MADAWESLVANSSLGSGDAWEHLQNQEGGGPGGALVLYDGVVVELETYAVEIEMSTLEVWIDE